MIATLLIVVLAAAHDAPRVGVKVSEAAREALGRGMEIRVEERDVAPAADEALELERRLGAEAVVVIAWRDAKATQALVRAHGRRGWTEREVDFDVSDPAEQRGKTLGFVIASLVAADVATPDVASTDVTPQLASEAPHDHLLIETTSLVLAAGNAEPLSGGGGASFLIPIHRMLAVEMTSDLTYGRAGDADAAVMTVRFGGGGALRLLREKRWELDLRADLLATFVTASRDGQSSSGWLPTARGSAVAILSPFGERFGFLALAGVDGSLGRVSIDVGSAAPLALSPWQVRVGLGVRFNF